MSYRYRLVTIDKKKCNKLRTSQNLDEVYSILGVKYEHPYEDSIYSDIGKELKDLGSDYSSLQIDDIRGKGKRLFNNDDIHNNYIEYHFVELNREALIDLVKIYEHKIKDYYERYSQKEHIEEYHRHFKYKAQMMGLGFFNLSDNKMNMQDSGFYEYEIFDLIAILKCFDWDNNTLLFYGW